MIIIKKLLLTNPDNQKAPLIGLVSAFILFSFIFLHSHSKQTKR